MAMVVAQLAEWSLPTPEIRGLNPNIVNVLFRTYLSVNCYPEKMKIKKKSIIANISTDFATDTNTENCILNLY